MQERNLWGLWGGAILIGLGIVFLVGQFLNINLWGYIWPLFVIAGGLAFFAGMLAGGKTTGALAVPGSVFVTVGLILFVQNLFGVWASWTYAWALIIAGAGVGLMIFGRRSEIPELRFVSRIVILVGLALFFAFGVLFELGAALFGLRSPGGEVWALALILLGIYVLLARPLQGLRDWTGSSRSGGYPPPPQPVTVVDAAAVDSPPPPVPPVAPLPPVESSVPAVPVDSAAMEAVRRVRFRSVGDVTIIQGSRTGLEIEASPEIKERIISEVRGSELTIRVDDNWLDWLNPRYWSFGPVRYTVYVKNLEWLEAGGVGNLVVPELVTPRLEVTLSATGNVTIRELETGYLHARLLGMGGMEIAGRADQQEVELSGAGSYQARSLESQKAQVRVSGLGSAEVWVRESLDAHLSGAGSVEYYGSPQISQRVSGLGNIHSKGER